MKIIFSRKGFDSAAGGSPSPIFPDGRMLSLPIPDKSSAVSYNEIIWGDYNVGEIVESISEGKIKSTYGAHLDPDLNETSISRRKGWKPLFGQAGAAQGHLRNQNVGSGDLLLFFGLFQEVITKNGTVELDPNAMPKHVIWGWFQIEKSMDVAEIDRSRFKWAVYHPHFHCGTVRSNTLYFPTRKLDIPGLAERNIGGAGVFPRFSKELQLTANNKKVSLWKLPLWMFPEDKETALTYHRKLERWEKTKDFALLQTVGRGQEFVLDCMDRQEAVQWVKNLFMALSGC